MMQYEGEETQSKIFKLFTLCCSGLIGHLLSSLLYKSHIPSFLLRYDQVEFEVVLLDVRAENCI
jgi:hypothetical protein